VSRKGAKLAKVGEKKEGRTDRWGSRRSPVDLASTFDVIQILDYRSGEKELDLSSEGAEDRIGARCNFADLSGRRF
jgi:hypothetical protein